MPSRSRRGSDERTRDDCENRPVATPLILIGLGANLPSPSHGAPKATLIAALERFEAVGIHVTARSRWYESEPVPKSTQPNFINAVVRVKTTLSPAALLAVLHRIEKEFGRAEGVRNAARCIDLDLIAYGDKVTRGETVPRLPHPRMHERAFVLLPLREIAPRWYHPFLGRPVDQLVDALPRSQVARPIA
jgi:2-amino-4-hydroxy-6-hydroxymethyldihydropteridine diphosphokinase